MKTAFISAAAVLAIVSAPVSARAVPTFYLPASAAAVAFSINGAVAPLEAGLRFGAPHQDSFSGRSGNAEAPGGDARQPTAKSPKVPEPSVPALLAAGAGMLFLARRRRVDNSVR